MTYVYLVLAIIFEVGWAISIKANHGFAPPIRLLPAAATLVMYVLSFVFLALAVRKLDIGLAYAIWAGLGAAVIAGIGILYYREPATAMKVISLALVVTGVVGLNLAGGGHGTTPTPSGGSVPAATHP